MSRGEPELTLANNIVKLMNNFEKIIFVFTRVDREVYPIIEQYPREREYHLLHANLGTQILYLHAGNWNGLQSIEIGIQGKIPEEAATREKLMSSIIRVGAFEVQSHFTVGPRVARGDGRVWRWERCLRCFRGPSAGMFILPRVEKMELNEEKEENEEKLNDDELAETS